MSKLVYGRASGIERVHKRGKWPYKGVGVWGGMAELARIRAGVMVINHIYLDSGCACSFLPLVESTTSSISNLIFCHESGYIYIFPC